MPLSLKPPRKGKTPNFSIRGSYLGVRVDKSCGTDKRSVARQVLQRLEKQIERGEYPPAETVSRSNEPNFVSAAVKYIEAGGEARYLSPLMKYFGETPLAEIDQDAIDEAARALRPNTTGATRNRCVYTPVSGVLRHAKVNIDLKRPIDAKAKRITDSLTPEDAAGIIEAANGFDPEYGLLLTFLLYTGCRLGEALSLRWDDLQLSQGTAYIRFTKNGDPRSIRLREMLCQAFGRHPKHQSGRVFRFRAGGHLKHQLVRAKLGYLGLPCPARRPNKWKPPVYRLAWVNHHTFRHTWATWMRRYGGLDLTGLKATGQWRDERSAARYAHAVPREEWSRVETLPDVNDPEWKTRGMEKIA